MQFALVLVLALLIGLTLGAVGGGGSILAVPVLVGVAGLAVTEATTASLIVVGTSAGIGLLAALRSGRVRVGTGMAFGLAGIGGAALGTQLNRGLDEGVLLLAFATLMALVAAKMTQGLISGAKKVRPAGALDERAAVSLVGATGPGPGTPATGTAATSSASSSASSSTSSGSTSGTSPASSTVGAPRNGPGTAVMVMRILVAGTLVGFLTGLFGVGGGFVIVPALMFLLGFDIREATATSLLVIAVNSAVALAMRADFGSVDWGVVAPFTALAAIGVLFGRGVADRVPTRTLSAALTVLVIAMAVWTAVQGISQIA